MSDAVARCATGLPQAGARHHRIGPLSFDWVAGGLRAIRFHGVEVIRAVTFPVRDADWGTVDPRLTAPDVRQDDDGLEITWRAVWVVGGITLRADLAVHATPDGLTMRGRGNTDGAFRTNRTGLTVLHPVEASGCPATVEHSDGPSERSRFPVLIEPWQPFMDIAALTHRQDGIVTACRFSGDTFEMEDHRQWSDASFKTYNRPLAKPWPYVIGPGEMPDQSVVLAFEGRPEISRRTGTRRVGERTGTVVPELALVVTPHEARCLLEATEPLDRIAPQRLTFHLDPAVDTDLTAFAALARRFGGRIDIEYAALCTGDPDTEFGELADRLSAAKLDPDSIFVCPSVDRQSTPPGSDWPPCRPLEETHAAVARAFPDIARGGGMLSYFTEFNRKPPPVHLLDYVAHGTNPIVHAADDTSVMQTLTALPWILRSGKAIAGATPYRLGLSTIPMRQNPYGARTIPNPDGGHVCMADCDPRHFTRFGAAFTLGYLAAIAPFGVAVWTPAAALGPCGVLQGDTLSPLGLLLADLAAMAGEPVRTAQSGDPARIAALAAGDALWLANLTDAPVEGLAPYEIRRTVQT